MDIEIIERLVITSIFDILKVKYDNKIYNIIIEHHCGNGEYNFFYLNGDRPEDIDFEHHVLCNL